MGSVLVVVLIAYVMAPIPLLVWALILNKEKNRLARENKGLRQQINEMQGQNSALPAVTPAVAEQAVREKKHPEAVPAAAVPARKGTVRDSGLVAAAGKKKSHAVMNTEAVLFFVGVFLVSVGISVFAASTWKYQGLVTKSLLMLAFSMIGFVSAWIAGNKLKLTQTSITAFSLGFVFIGGILFLAAGAEAFGGLFSMEGRGLCFLLSMVFLLVIGYGFSVRILYGYSWSRWLSLAAYLFFLLFFVRFIDCGQNLFPFLFLISLSAAVLFYREQDSRAVRIIAILVTAGTGIAGFTASFVSLFVRIMFPEAAEIGFISCLSPSLILYLTSLGAAVCGVIISRKLKDTAAVLPLSFLAFIYTFQDLYLAAAGIFIMTAAGCMTVWKKGTQLNLFKKVFLIMVPILIVLLMPAGSQGERWMYVVFTFCISGIFTFYSIIDRKPAVMSVAFVSLPGFVFAVCYAVCGEVSVWMGWAAVLLCGIGTLALRRLAGTGSAESYKAPQITAMCMGMACAVLCPRMGNVPICLAAMAVLVLAVYPTRLQLLLVPPLVRFCLHLNDILLALPIEFRLKEYAVIILIFLLLLLLSRISDRGKGAAGINCFAFVSLMPIVYTAAVLMHYKWQASLLLLMLSSVAAVQIRREPQKKNCFAVPLAAVLLMLAVWQQPFFEWPDYLYCKLPALIPLLTLMICRKVSGRFRFFETAMCIGTLVFLTVVFVEIVIRNNSIIPADPGSEIAIVIIDKILFTAIAALMMLLSRKHAVIWYYAGFAGLMVMGIYSAAGEDGFISAVAGSCLALAASFIPDKDGKCRNALMFSGAALVFAMMMPWYGEKMQWFVCFAVMTVTVFLLLRKQFRRFRSYIVAVGTLLLLLTVYLQPFFGWPDIIAGKLLFLIPAADLLIIRMVCGKTQVQGTDAAAGYQDNSDRVVSVAGRLLPWSFIFIMAALFVEALVTGKLADAIITAAVCLMVMLLGAVRQKRLLLYGGAGGVITVVVYMTRGFWTSLPWWVYLIAAGAAAIVIAVVIELKKKKIKG